VAVVQFRDNGPARSVGQVCAEFCARWRGSDVAEGARLLQGVLPERVPGALQLVILRALGQIDLPAFTSPDDFRAAIRRFAAQAVELNDISDVRRARRNSRMTLERLSREAALPRWVVLQLEWGDFREWHDAEWTRRVCHAYARGAALSTERVSAIVHAERIKQIGNERSRRPWTAAPHRLRTIAAAAAITLALLPAVLLKDRIDLPWPDRTTGNLAVVRDLAAEPHRAAEEPRRVSPPRVPPSRAAARRMEPHQAGALRMAPASPVARVAGPASFSPAFSSAGGTVFFHQNHATGSALMKAAGGTDGELRIVRVVENGARNYHAKPSPDGSRIAFDSDRDGERGVYIANSDGSGITRVSGPGFAAVPSWSPDGTRLAFVRGEASQGNRVWNLWLQDLASNVSVRLTAYKYGQPWGASWFPDGRRLAYSHETRLHVLDLETGARRTFGSPVKGRLLRTPAVSPDGRHVVFQVHRNGAWLLDLQNGSMRRILTDPTAEEFAWDASGRKLAFHSRRSGAWSVWIMSATGA
jgi:hypothetical protein